MTLDARLRLVTPTCSILNGGGAGKKALRASDSLTALSLPIVYRLTSRSGSAPTSRTMGVLCDSRCCRRVAVAVAVMAVAVGVWVGGWRSADALTHRPEPRRL